MVEYVAIDSDTHITEPADVWTARVPSRFRDRVPHIARNDVGQDVWVIDGQPMSAMGFTATAGWKEDFPSGPATYEECLPAAYDAKARLEYMDSQGVWAQVIYPNVGGFGSQRFLGMDDEELKLTCVRAYNDFQRDWAEPDPRRFVTLVATPFWDVDATVAEVERGAEMGHRGILFTGEPQVFGLPMLGDPHWDPLWSVARDTGLPIHFHIGSGDMGTAFVPERAVASGMAASYGYAAVSLFMKNGVQVADLLLSGVLPRYPEVNFVSVESGIGWLPFVLEACDYHVTEAEVQGREAFKAGLPSELFARQVYACFWFEQTPLKRFLDLIPTGNLLFETDFPHPTCLYDNVQERIAANLGHLPEDTRRKLLWENAAQLYGIDAPTPAIA